MPTCVVSEPIAAFCIMVVLPSISVSSEVVVVLDADLSVVLPFVFLHDFNILPIIWFPTENFTKKSNYPKKNCNTNTTKDPFLIFDYPVNNFVDHIFTCFDMLYCCYSQTDIAILWQQISSLVEVNTFAEMSFSLYQTSLISSIRISCDLSDVILFNL